MPQENNNTIDQLKNFLSSENAAENINMLINMLSSKNAGQSESQDLNENKNVFGQQAVNQDNIATIMKIKKVYDKIATANDPRINLLLALKPYLSQKRADRLDSAIKMVHLTKLSSVVNEFENL